jgi:hypothetical protein
MDYEPICSWLGLPPGTWPPDHYRLLGLTAGEDKVELIEQRVHERLEIVRRYQIMHPEQATEAMNRLAQAFVCLTEPNSKIAYDRQQGIAKPAAPSQAVAAPPSADDVLDWFASPLPETAAKKKATLTIGAGAASSRPFSSGPPPLPPALLALSRATVPPLPKPPPLPQLTPALEQTDEAETTEVMPTAPLPTQPEPREPVCPILEAAESKPARRGIATKRALYQRVALTRRLHHVWNELGRYVSSPRRRLNRAVEGPELVRLLEEITTLLGKFPPLMGEAGQPGYLVLALTQLDTVKDFQRFSEHQREALSRDWQAGLKLLTAHRHFLRHQLRAMRKRPFRQHLLHAAQALVVDQPGTVFLLLALLVVNLVLWRSYIEALWDQLFSR